MCTECTAIFVWAPTGRTIWSMSIMRRWLHFDSRWCAQFFSTATDHLQHKVHVESSGRTLTSAVKQFLSTTQSRDCIKAGYITVDGRTIRKPSYMVPKNSIVQLVKRYGTPKSAWGDALWRVANRGAVRPLTRQALT